MPSAATHTSSVLTPRCSGCGPYLKSCAITFTSVAWAFGDCSTGRCGNFWTTVAV
jgi:hypothetical protein